MPWRDNGIKRVNAAQLRPRAAPPRPPAPVRQDAAAQGTSCAGRPLGRHGRGVAWSGAASRAFEGLGGASPPPPPNGGEGLPASLSRASCALGHLSQDH